MEVRLSIGGHVFTGLLQAASAPLPRARPALPGPAPAVLAGAAAEGDAGAAPSGRAALQPAASGVSSEQRADTPAATGGVSAAGVGRGAAAPAPPQEGDSRPGAAAAAAVDAEIRRAAAEERIRVLEAEGAPPGTKCALCRGSDTDVIPDEERGEKGCSLRGMGPLILVRVSGELPRHPAPHSAALSAPSAARAARADAAARCRLLLSNGKGIPVRLATPLPPTLALSQ
jgi:hypothetical protein